jgi:hypothetical protein
VAPAAQCLEEKAGLRDNPITHAAPQPTFLHVMTFVYFLNSITITSNGVSPTFSGRCFPASAQTAL